MEKLPIKHSLIHWLPFIVFLIGIAISGYIWRLLYQEESHLRLIPLLKFTAPWLVLVSGILISLLLAALLQLSHMNKERKKSLTIMSENFQKEIVERIRAEKGKQDLEKGLFQGQKLQAIGTLAGGIAHDFNNILYAIIGFTEMARQEVPKNSIVYQNLGKVLEASQRGKELIARILAFGRKQHQEFKPLALKPTIENVLSLLRSTIPTTVSLEFSSEPQELIILGNQTLLHQVIINIINNAVDAMDSEGSVKIALSLEQKKSKEFSHPSTRNYCRIDIIDSGHGMDQHTLSRIFDPFFTTKEVGKGTGLGLSMVHTIIEEHHGKVKVFSQVGKGTSFTILLPEYNSENNPKENGHGNNSISGR